jgi:hypothetical protein
MYRIKYQDARFSDYVYVNKERRYYLTYDQAREYLHRRGCFGVVRFTDGSIRFEDSGNVRSIQPYFVSTRGWFYRLDELEGE